MSVSKHLGPWLLIGTMLVVVAPAGADASTVLLQTGFEADAVGSKPPGSTIGTGGTDVGSGFVTAGFPPFVTLGCENRGGGFTGNCLFLGSPISSGTSITSVQNFAAGEYVLTFDYYFASDTTVSLGDFTASITGPASAQTFSSEVFSVTSPAQLIFSGGVGGVADLDNIMLTRVDPTTPAAEPLTMLLTSTGVAGMVLRRVRQASARKRSRPDA